MTIFRGPLFYKPVTGKELFLLFLMYSKPALVTYLPSRLNKNTVYDFIVHKNKKANKLAAWFVCVFVWNGGTSKKY